MMAVMGFEERRRATGFDKLVATIRGTDLFLRPRLSQDNVLRGTVDALSNNLLHRDGLVEQLDFALPLVIDANRG